MANEREMARLQRIAEINHLETAADLDAFLAADAKTKDDPVVREQWRERLQTAVPKLRSVIV